MSPLHDRSGCPPPNYSFPTRRSSDLGPLASNDYGTVYLTKLDPTVTGPSSLIYSTYIAGTGGDFANRDRKSTRLNSSHRCISYAVFCLKKKKRCSTCSSQFRQHGRSG